MSEPLARPKKRKRPNLEFNFITGASPSSKRTTQPEANKSIPTPEASKPKTLEPSISKLKNPTSPEISIQPSIAPTTPPMNNSEATKSTTSNPAPIRTHNMDRQIKEQKTVGNVLNSMALALVCGTLLVTALAGTGGYVLWKQLQNQSASLSLLEQNTKDRMFDLKAELVASDTDLNKSLEQANLRLIDLTTQFESYRSETTQLLADLKTTNRSLERSLTLYQRKAQEQETQLAQLRRNR